MLIYKHFDRKQTFFKHYLTHIAHLRNFFNFRVQKPRFDIWISLPTDMQSTEFKKHRILGKHAAKPFKTIPYTENHEKEDQDQRLITMRPKLGHNETKAWSQRDQRLVTTRPKAGHNETKNRSQFWSRKTLLSNILNILSNKQLTQLSKSKQIKGTSASISTKSSKEFRQKLPTIPTHAREANAT